MFKDEIIFLVSLLKSSSLLYINLLYSFSEQLLSQIMLLFSSLVILALVKDYETSPKHQSINHKKFTLDQKMKYPLFPLVIYRYISMSNHWFLTFHLLTARTKNYWVNILIICTIKHISWWRGYTSLNSWPGNQLANQPLSKLLYA